MGKITNGSANQGGAEHSQKLTRSTKKHPGQGHVLDSFPIAFLPESNLEVVTADRTPLKDPRTSQKILSRPSATHPQATGQPAGRSKESEPRVMETAEGFLTALESNGRDAQLRGKVSDSDTVSYCTATSMTPESSRTQRVWDHNAIDTIAQPDEGSDEILLDASPESGYDNDLDEPQVRSDHASNPVVLEGHVSSKPLPEQAEPREGSKDLQQDLQSFTAGLRVWSEARAAKRRKVSGGD